MQLQGDTCFGDLEICFRTTFAQISFYGEQYNSIISPPHTLCSFFIGFNFVGGCVAALKLTFFFTVQARVARRAHTLALDTAAAVLALNVGLADISHDLATLTCRVT